MPEHNKQVYRHAFARLVPIWKLKQNVSISLPTVFFV